MMKHHLLVCSMLLIVGGACHEHSRERPADLIPAVVDGSNHLGFEIFRRLSAADADSTICVAPLNVTLPLVLLMTGATGTTRDEIAAALKLSDHDPDVVADACRLLIDSLTNGPDAAHPLFEHSVWADRSVTLNERFRETARRQFGAAIITGNARQAMSPASERALTITGRFALDAAWDEPFDARDTYDAEFQPRPDVRVPCRMMKLDRSVEFYRNDSLECVVMHYKGGSLRAFCFLPSRKLGIGGLVALLTDEGWRSIRENIGRDKLEVDLPKLRLASSFRLNSVFSMLGADAAFTPGSAELDDVGTLSEGRTLYVEKITHEVGVTVSEQYTHVEAKTDVDMLPYAALPDSLAPIVFYRPFVMVIQERRTGAILMLARVMRPG